jgi:RNA polymerase sigma-70 factor (TIGR02943 family)
MDDSSKSKRTTPDAASGDTPASTANMGQNRVRQEQWVDEYGDYLFRYAFSRLNESNAAEEVVQETFLAGLRHRAQFRGAGSERAWLLGILKRKIIDLIRARQRAGAIGGDDSEREASDATDQLFDAEGNWSTTAQRFASPEQRLSNQELWQIVRGCLKHLPKGQADVFVLSVMEDMDSDEICQELSISPANYWVRLHRARLRLASCVAAKWVDPKETQNA